jgi:methionyl-tRNA synthetase
MSRTFFITTAIDYTNSAPHIGHAYEKVLADVMARYHRLKGENVFFLTGVDQHGQKVQQSAAKEGVAPADFVRNVTDKFIDLWKKLDVRYDAWAETISPGHKKVVQGILQRLFDEGQIYKDKQSGFYSVRQEQFLTDKERGPDGQYGPEWGQVEEREEENYYFKLNQHKDWLLKYLDSRKDAVVPDFRQTELRNAVEKLSGDLCISRPKSRLDWGIELPFDKDFVTYVWFDALTNYISFSGYDPGVSAFNSQPSTFLARWPAVQVIGKDILIPAHGIYWLIMLRALGFPDEQMPQLLVHGWWNLGGAKISKSAGNVIDPNALADKYGAEGLRYYLMSDIATGRDADFSEERLVERHNAELANTLGNLVNRTLNMAQRYRGGKLIWIHRGSSRSDDQIEAGWRIEGLVDDKGEPLLWYLPRVQTDVEDLADRAVSGLDEFDPAEALHCIGQLATLCNSQIEIVKPWKSSKDPNAQELVDDILYGLAEAIRIIAILVSPVAPKAAHGIFDQLNWKLDLNGTEERFSLKDAEWGQLPDGHVVGAPVPLFPRIETAVSG